LCTFDGEEGVNNDELVNKNSVGVKRVAPGATMPIPCANDCGSAHHDDKKLG
jgi:hypothetical protein